MGTAMGCNLEGDDIMPLRRKGSMHVLPQRAQDPTDQATANIGPVVVVGRGRVSREAGVEHVIQRRHACTLKLFEAAMAGDPRLIRVALEAKADPNSAADATGLRALHLCVSQGHVGAAQPLLEQMADLDCFDNVLGMSPLSMASLAGHSQAVQFLLSNGASMDEPEGDGGVPLLHAARRNFAEVCELLVHSGADANATLRKSTNPANANAALKKGTFPNGDWRGPLSNPGAGSPPNPMERLMDKMEWLSVEGVTPLHFGAAHGSVRICGVLLGAGARVRAKDMLGRTPLAIAGDSGHVEACRLIIERQACVSADCEGHTVATLAARAGHVSILRLLMDTDVVKIDDTTYDGGVAMLHVAVQMGQGGCVSMLCERDADVEMTLKPGKVTPLMLAASRGHGDICRELIAYGANINESDDDGRSAWLRAASSGYADICHLLSNFGAVERVSASTTKANQLASAAAGDRQLASTAALGAPIAMKREEKKTMEDKKMISRNWNHANVMYRPGRTTPGGSPGLYGA